jgi:endo-1,3(4)-beta-glucanase
LLLSIHAQGYILYASAILGELDPSFVRKHGEAVDAISYDVTYDANFKSQRSGAPFFPGARHKSWFDGHSFASGLWAFGNGKSMESSSESVNCYYGAYLWSLVRHNASNDPDSDASAQTDFARLLLAMEIRGVQLYWHMTPTDSTTNSSLADPVATVYSNEFSKNYMVGNLGMLDALYTTWFGTKDVYVHMINELPVTAITENLFDKRYVEQEYSKILSKLHHVEASWKGFVICNHAIVDPNAAWKEAQKLDSRLLDAGISKSQILFWIATRKDFNMSQPTDSSTDSSENTPESDSKSSGDETDDTASCSLHPACIEAELTGFCCPTNDGTSLGCCGSR